MKINKLLIFGIIGSVLWLFADYMISFLPNGIFRGSHLADEVMLKTMLTDAPVWRFTMSAVIQSFGMVLVTFGYFSIFFDISFTN